MKYTIQLTGHGCIETLELKDGTKLSVEWVGDFWEIKSKNPSLTDQLKKLGYDEEILEAAENLFDGMHTMDFVVLGRQFQRFARFVE